MSDEDKTKLLELPEGAYVASVQATGPNVVQVGDETHYLGEDGSPVMIGTPMKLEATSAATLVLADEVLRKQTDNKGSTYSLAEVLQVLKNSGIDVECGACMKVAFTGVTTAAAAHECKRVGAQPRRELHLETQNRALRAKLTRAKAFLKSLVFSIDELKLDDEIPAMVIDRPPCAECGCPYEEHDKGGCAPHYKASKKAGFITLCRCYKYVAPAAVPWRPPSVSPVEVKVCTQCGGSGEGPDQQQGAGDVYQGKCGRCKGTGEDPEQ